MILVIRQIAMTAAFHYCAPNQAIVLGVQLIVLLSMVVLQQLVGELFLPSAVAARVLRQQFQGVRRRSHYVHVTMHMSAKLECHVDCHKKGCKFQAVKNHT
jgi:hypothetical protein